MANVLAGIRLLKFGVLSATLAVTVAANAQCVGLREEGRWHNLDPNGEPAYIDVKTVGGCGDVSANGQPASSAQRHTMRVWVKQSSGKMYGRPPVNVAYRLSRGQKWLFGSVPTGGYVDRMWLRVEQHDGRQQLHVLIRHESLDRKPSSDSNYWYTR